MNCYTVEKTEYSWDEPETSIVGNAVYASKEKAQKAAKNIFRGWLAGNPHVGKNAGDAIEENNDVCRAYASGQSVTVRVVEHVLID